MRTHLAYGFTSGLAVGLAAALVDAAVLGNLHLRWLAFAFLVYGLAVAAAELVLAAVTGTICRLRGCHPNPRWLAVFYLGLPAFALLAVSSGEAVRRFVIPALLESRHEFLPVLFASLCGLVAGGAFVGLLAAAARKGSESKALSFAGWSVVALACLSFVGLVVAELAYGLRSLEGKNVIIVSIDALRADHLSCYGYDRTTSPNIDKLARGGARFERAICQSPGSTASHASILTSLYPLTHGAWNVGSSLHENVYTLQEHLRDHGYVTAFFANNYFLQKRFGFAQGFDTFGNEGKVQLVGNAPLQAYPLSLGAFRLAHAWRTKPGEASEFTIDQALSWIERNRKKKFFVFLHVMDPHSPYSPPGEYRRAFFSRAYDREIEDGPNLRSRLSSLTPEERQQLVDLYDGEIAYADSKMGRLMEALRDWGLEDSTVVVITADHAEVLDEHGGLFNHGYLWDSCIRVPLILSYPAAVPGGGVIGQIVETIDIVPTVLALIEEPPLPGAQGADLSELIIENRGETKGVAFTLGGITEGEGYSITTSRWKLAWIDEEHVELYDLLNDPAETRNLLADEPQKAAELQRQLLSWVSESREAAVVPRSETVALERLDRETRERLRALGYID